MKKYLSIIFIFVFLYCPEAQPKEDVDFYEKAKRSYETGIELYKNKKYDKALQCFIECMNNNESYLRSKGEERDLANYISQLPTNGWGHYSSNANDWAASCYYLMGDEKRAKELSVNYKLKPLDQKQTTQADLIIRSVIGDFLSTYHVKEVNFPMFRRTMFDWVNCPLQEALRVTTGDGIDRYRKEKRVKEINLAIDYYEKAVGKDNIYYVNAVALNAWTHLINREFKEAGQLLLRAKNILTGIDETHRLLSIMNDLISLTSSITARQEQRNQQTIVSPHRQLYEKGVEAFNNQNYKDAISLFTESKKLCEKYSSVLNAGEWLAAALFRSGDEKAAKQYSTNYRLQPTYFNEKQLEYLRIHEQAKRYLNSKNYKDAMHDAQRAYKAIEKDFGHDNPYTVDILNTIANILFDQKKYKEAIETLQEEYAIYNKIDAKNSYLKTIKNNINTCKRLIDGEANTFVSADELYNKGIKCYQKKNYTQALELFAECDSVNAVSKRKLPYYSSNAKEWIASCYYKIGKHDEAYKLTGFYCQLEPADQRLTQKSDSCTRLAIKEYYNTNWSSTIDNLRKAQNYIREELGDNHYRYANAIGLEACFMSYMLSFWDDTLITVGRENITYDIAKDRFSEARALLKRINSKYDNTLLYSNKLIDASHLAIINVLYASTQKAIFEEINTRFDVGKHLFNENNPDYFFHEALAFLDSRPNDNKKISDFADTYIKGLKKLATQEQGINYEGRRTPNMATRTNNYPKASFFIALISYLGEHADYETFSKYSEQALSIVSRFSDIYRDAAPVYSKYNDYFCELGVPEALQKKEELNAIPQIAINSKDITMDDFDKPDKTYEICRAYYGENDHRTLGELNRAIEEYIARADYERSESLIISHFNAILENKSANSVNELIDWASTGEKSLQQTLIKELKRLPWDTYFAKMREYDKAIGLCKLITDDDNDDLLPFYLMRMLNYYYEIGDVNLMDKTVDLFNNSLEKDKDVKSTLLDYHGEELKLLEAKYLYLKGDYNKAAKYFVAVDEEKLNNRLFGGMLDNKLNDFGIKLFNKLNDDARLADCQEKLFREKREFIKSKFQNLVKDRRSAFWQNNKEVFTGAYNYAMKFSGNQDLARQAYDAALLSKGILLNAERDFSKMVAETHDDKLIADYQKLQSWKLECLQKGEMKEEDALKIAEFESDIMRRVDKYGNYTTNMLLTMTDVRSALSKNSIAVEFISYSDDSEQKYAALVLRKDWLAPKCVLLGLKSDFSAYEKSGSMSYGMQEFSEKVWRPIIDVGGIAEGDTIFFSPDGLFYNCAIEYLPANTHQLMCEKYNLFRLTSTREICHKSARKNQSESILMGGAVYSASKEALMGVGMSKPNDEQQAFLSNRSLSNDAGLTYLPGTKTEVDNISAILKKHGMKSISIVGEEFTEAAFKSLNERPIDMLHISTHGFYWRESVAKRKNLSFIKNLKNKEESVMTRSGLFASAADYVMSGAKIPAGLEDGVITAQEIASLDLSNVNMIVLSACQTGVGELDDDGVFGLQRGFKKAGAGSLMMSLWKVDDEATSILMSEFYTNLTLGEKKNMALLKAQNKLRTIQNSRFSDPKYWAAFIILDAIEN